MKLSPKLVSIVTPAYRAEKTVASAIRSAQAQTYTQWEMFVVDDGSTDRTADIVCEIAKCDPRVRLIQQANSGPAMARQMAIQQAHGRYIAFLDSDDLWLPNKLMLQIEFMSQNDAPISFTSFRRIREDGSGEGHKIQIPPRVSYHQLLGNTALATSTVIIDRGMVGEFRMRNTYYDDFVLWLEILKQGFEAHGLDQDLMRYRVMNGSVSRNKVHSARMVWNTYREIEKISVAMSAYHLMRYAFHAWRKYRKF